MKFLTNIDLNKNELQNVRIQNLATAPQNPVEGQLYYNTTEKLIFQWNGTAWVTVGGDIPIASASVLGGIMVGDGLDVDATGVLSTEIQTIKVNGAAQVVTNNEVDLDVPEVSINEDTGIADITDPDGKTVRFSQALENVAVKFGSGTPTVLASTDYVDNAIPTKTSELTNDGDGTSPFATEADLGDYLELAGGTMTGAIAMGSNKITGLADPTAEADAVNKKYVDAVAVGALKPSGSVAFANLPALAAGVVNNMYNVTDAFTTTADFIEGAGHDYPAGTNVAIINVGTAESPSYKYDAMTGAIDVSGFATKTEVNGIFVTTLGTITPSMTSVTVPYSGTVLNIIALQNGQEVITDITKGVASVTFTCASAPSSDITCKVIAAGTLS